MRLTVTFGNTPVSIADAISVGLHHAFARWEGDEGGMSIHRVVASYRRLQQLLDSGDIIYGTATGVGANVGHIIPESARSGFQEKLAASLYCGTDPWLPPHIVRAFLFLRLCAFARGYSAVSPELLRRITCLLNADLLPFIPRYGSQGASGDLVPSDPLCVLLIGRGKALWKGEPADAREALAKEEIAPYAFGPKEALAIVNSVCPSLAVACFALFDLDYFLRLSYVLAALYVEAMAGMEDTFYSLPHDLQRLPGQSHIARVVRLLLDGSAFVTNRNAIVQGMRNHDPKFANRPLQDPYTLRCIPSGLGPCVEKFWSAKKTVERLCNGVSDNPLIDREGPPFVYHNGNFMGTSVAMEMDVLKIALSYFAIWHQMVQERLLNPAENNGLPANLMPNTAFHSGFKGVGLSMGSYAAEVRQRSLSHLVFSTKTECANQDIVSYSLNAAANVGETLELFSEILARNLLTLVQAVECRAKAPIVPGRNTLGLGGTFGVCAWVRERVKFRREDDFELSKDITTVRDAIRRHDIPLPADAR